MKIILLSTAILLFSSIGFSQVVRKTGELTKNVYSGALVETFTEYVPSKLLEESYLDIQWSLGSVDLFGGTEFEIKNIPVRYNITNKQLEVKINNDVKVAKASLIERFKWLDLNGDYIEFINGSLINQSKEEIFKVIYEGVRYTACIGYSYEKLAPDYNPQFDVGSRTERIVTKKYYLLFDALDKTANEFNLKTKSFAKLFSTKPKEKKIIINNKVKSTEDIAEILDKIDQ